MTPPLPLLDNTTFVISPTQSEVIRTCPRMWSYRYLHRRVAATPNAASQGGKAFDAALNHRYKKLGSAPCDPETEAEMLALIDDAYTGVELPLEEHRTPARFKETVVAYNKFWGREGFTVLGVQVPFAVLLGEVDPPYGFWARMSANCQHDFTARPINIHDEHRDMGLECTKCSGFVWQSDWDRGRELHYDEDHKVKVVVQGLLDLFVEAAGYTTIIDTKTSNNDIGSNYDNSAQLKCYMWALQELARLHPGAGFPPTVHSAQINGVIIRPPYKNENRTSTAKDKPRNEFVRTFPTFYSQERLEEWREDTLKWAEQVLRWVGEDYFPQNEKSCGFYMDAAFKNYGTYGKSCPYLGVCTLPAAQRETALGSDQFMDYGKGPLGELRSMVKEEVVV